MSDGKRLRLRRIAAILLCIAVIVSFSGCGGKSGTEETEFTAYYEPLAPEDIATEGDVYYAASQVLLTSVSDASYKDVEKLVKNNGGEIIGYISATGDYQTRFSNCRSLEELEQLVDTLKSDALVEDASLAYVAQFGSEAVDYTNDPWVDDYNTDDTSGSVWDEDHPDGKNWWAEAIGMPSVWSMDLSTQTVKVGIIDGMFDVTNKDLDEGLFAKTWNNPESEDGTCNVTPLYSDAVAAYVQAVSGGDQQEIKTAAKRVSKASHGTHVAGIIAAQAENGDGIAGVNQNVELYGYSMMSGEAAASDEAQWGTIFNFKCAIAHLLNEGVKVINISMGINAALKGTQDGDPYWSTFTSVSSKALESFLLKYIEAGYEFLIVKAAGNDSDSDKKYDAGNDFFGAISNEQVAHRIIVVGNAKNNANKGYYSIAEDSNTGSRVNVYAPGTNILSVVPSYLTTVMSGTSMAAPVVTGLASLIWGINPELSAEQVRSIIIASTSATIFNLVDDENDPTAIVNANICVQLAQSTIGNGSTPNAEFGTISGVVYATTPDGSGFVDVDIETLSLYDEGGALVSTVPLQSIVPDDNAGSETAYMLRSYSLLVEPGTYTLKAEAEGYEPQEQEISVGANSVIKVDFKLASTANTGPLVSDAFSDYGIRNDGRVNNYRIPKINISGKAAEETNAIIYDDLYYGVYEQIENKRGQCGSSGITYSWTESNGIISIIARWMPEDYTGNGSIDFETYNASSETGALLSLETITQAYNLTVDEFNDLVIDVMESQFIQINGQIEEDDPEWVKEFYNNRLNLIRSDEYINNIKPFISENGDLCVVAVMYYVVSMQGEEKLINLTGDATPQEPAFSWVVPEENPDETPPGEPQNTGATGEYFIGTVTAPDAGAETISTPRELVDKVTANPAGNYVLACDIDLSTYNGGVWVSLEQFSGTLDGQGHVIRGLKVTSYEDSGLFLSVDGATFKDLGVEAIEVSGYDNTGVLSARGTANFTNCYVICPNLSGRDNVGGLIGRGDTSTLRDVFVDVSIQGNAEAYYSTIYDGHASVCRAGGVIGNGNVDANNIVVICDIAITGSGKPADGEIMAGGVIGCTATGYSGETARVDIINANVDCTINVKTARYISWSELSSGNRSYDNVDVHVGGLIGDDYRDHGWYIQSAINIEQCNVNVDIEVDAYGTPCAGGFIGYEDGYNDSGEVVTITDSRLTGSVSVLCNDGSYAMAGGVFGDHPVNLGDKITVAISDTAVQCQVSSKGGYYTTYGGAVSCSGDKSIEIEDCSIDVDLTVTPGGGDVYIDGEKQ